LQHLNTTNSLIWYETTWARGVLTMKIGDITCLHFQINHFVLNGLLWNTPNIVCRRMAHYYFNGLPLATEKMRHAIRRHRISCINNTKRPLATGRPSNATAEGCQVQVSNNLWSVERKYGYNINTHNCRTSTWINVYLSLHLLILHNSSSTIKGITQGFR
jgi:hypothetical protein